MNSRETLPRCLNCSPYGACEYRRRHGFPDDPDDRPKLTVNPKLDAVNIKPGKIYDSINFCYPYELAEQLGPDWEGKVIIFQKRLFTKFE